MGVSGILALSREGLLDIEPEGGIVLNNGVSGGSTRCAMEKDISGEQGGGSLKTKAGSDR